MTWAILSRTSRWTGKDCSACLRVMKAGDEIHTLPGEAHHQRCHGAGCPVEEA